MAGVEEAEAVRIALRGSRSEKLSAILGAARRLAADPTRTEQVFVIGLIMNAPRVVELERRWRVSEEGRWLLAHRPAIDREAVDFDGLRALPSHTLGGAYARFLDREGLDPDVFHAPPGMPESMAYFFQRMRQTHDLWHVLVGCGTDPAGELALQGFYYGQLGLPLSALLVALGLVRSAVVAVGASVLGPPARPAPAPGALLREVTAQHARGRRARFLAPLHWERRWERPLSEVRRELAIADPVPAPRAGSIALG